MPILLKHLYLECEVLKKKKNFIEVLPYHISQICSCVESNVIVTFGWTLILTRKGNFHKCSCNWFVGIKRQTKCTEIYLVFCFCKLRDSLFPKHKMILEQTNKMMHGLQP